MICDNIFTKCTYDGINLRIIYGDVIKKEKKKKGRRIGSKIERNSKRNHDLSFVKLFYNRVRYSKAGSIAVILCRCAINVDFIDSVIALHVFNNNNNNGNGFRANGAE